jgi:hypothetical protein
MTAVLRGRHDYVLLRSRRATGASIMICLTGDLHHMGLATGNQAHCDITELETAQLFLSLLEERDIPVTFFVSGRCFVDEWAELEPIAGHPLVTLGGHNYSCFTPELFHRVSNKLLGSYNGPAWAQRLDAQRTMQVAWERTGRRLEYWRNHMYMHGPHTERVLARLGFRMCSDGVARDGEHPVWHEEGIYNFPINVIPDHEHLYHAERTPEWVAAWQKRYDWSDDWGSDSYPIDEWVELVLGDLRRNEARGAISNMIIHPITMYLCDRFEGVKRILDFLAQRETISYSQLYERMADTQAAVNAQRSAKSA